MSSEVIFSSSRVSNSITTNPTTTSIDVTSPLSFFNFLQNIEADYTADQYNNLYIKYLQEWSEVKSTLDNTKTLSVVELYISFLKEVVITYSTQQELRFLSTLDFSDPVDLDIIIPIYVEKLRQIIIMYKERRDYAKYSIDRFKIKGTQTSVERAIFEQIYNYIFNSTVSISINEPTTPISIILSNMNINIEEFVDVHSKYFDIPRDKPSNTTLRDELSSANINSIDINLFFSAIDANDIFRSEIFLSEVPIAINYATTIDAQCDPTNPLLLISSEATRCGISLRQQDILKRELISKYIGVDFYYTSTFNNTLCSGRFIKAQNPSSNIPNLQVADTATIQSNELKLLRDVGLFFKPDKTGIIQLNSNNYTYRIDETKIEKDKLYIYPDPAVYGNVSINKQSNYPLIFIHNYEDAVRNSTAGLANGQPSVSNYEQTVNAYYAKNNLITSNASHPEGLNLNFSDLSNKGYIAKLQYDVYGNEYALFKEELGHTFRQYENVAYSNTILNLQLDGHTFLDLYEGYNFDYSTTGKLDSSFRSGVRTNTANDVTYQPITTESSPTLSILTEDCQEIIYAAYSTANFKYANFPLHCNLRSFTPYEELIVPSRNVIAKFRDGGSFVSNSVSITAANDDSDTLQEDGLPLDIESTDNSEIVNPVYTTVKSLVDSLSGADSNAYPLNIDYYYTELVDAGISSLTPITRATFTLSASFTYDLFNSYSSALVEEYYCGLFTDTDLELVNDFNYKEGISIYNNINESSVTQLETLGDASDCNGVLNTDVLKAQAIKQKLSGKLFIKNQKYSTSQQIFETFGFLDAKYSNSVYRDVIDNMCDFDVIYDTVIFETEQHLIFEKIRYSDNKFTLPLTKNNIIVAKQSNIRDKFSNRFFNERNNMIIFCTVGSVRSSTLNSSTLNDSIILLPTIYQYSIKTNEISMIFPQRSNLNEDTIAVFNIASYFTSTFDVVIVKINKPVITFNYFNNIYKLTYTCTDNNNMVYLFDIDFEVGTTSVRLIKNRFFKQNKMINTTNFTNDFNSSREFVDINSINGNITRTSGVISL